jgi:outer membrane protein assembly factor BamB
MIKTSAFQIFVAVSLIVSFSGQNLSAQSWPQWRGNELNSVAADTKVPTEISKDAILWRTELPGPAGASPIVIDDHVFLTTVEGEDFHVMCIARDGSIKWKKQVEGKDKVNRDGGNLASSSPCSDGKHVWTMFGNGIVSCFTLEGENVWSKDLQQEYGKFDIQFGMSTTPILVENQLIITLLHGAMRGKETSKGILVSLDPQTGNENWKHLRLTDGVAENKHSYASPAIAKIDGETVFLVHGGDYTTAHQFSDGSEVWRLGGMNPKGNAYNMYLRFVSSPVTSEGLTIVPTAKSGPVLALDANKDGEIGFDALTWKTEQSTPDVSTPVIYNGKVFLSRENGVLICLDAKTGEKKSQKRYFADKHRSTPVACNGVLFVVDRQGKLFSIKADESLDEVSSLDLGEETLSSPAVSNGRLYIRTFEALYCFGNSE